MPKNDEGPSTPYIDLATLTSTSATETPSIPAIPAISDIKLIIQYNGCGNYTIPKNAFIVGELPKSPRTRGRLQPNEPSTSQTSMNRYSNFRSWGDLGQEVIEEDPSHLLYQDNRLATNFPMDENNKGLQMMLTMGYDRN